MKHFATVKYWPSQPAGSQWVVRYRQGGKPIVRYFGDEKSAKIFAQEKSIELRREGNEHDEFSLEERRAVFLAREKKMDLRDAVEYYGEHLAALSNSAVVEIAIDEFLSIREAEGKSIAHRNDLRNRLGRFARSFGERSVASITLRELDGWLHGLPVALVTRMNFRRILHNFFGFCTARGYCPGNIASEASKPKVPQGEIGILTVSEAEALLSFADTPDVAIGMFAGLRREEIARLDWADIDLDEGLILVKAANSKTAQRRHVEISDNLRVWLAPHRQDSGPVRLPNYRKRLAKAAALAGITSWPHNALRHSFASYHLAFYKDSGKTAVELGHTESRTLFAHYRQLVKPEDAKAFWQIFPRNRIKLLTVEAA